MKPTTNDKINWTLVGCRAQFLTVDDTIQSGDFVRELHESGWLDGGFDTTFKSEKWRGTQWHKVDDDMPAWIGRTYREYLEFCDNTDAIMEHEIARII